MGSGLQLIDVRESGPFEFRWPELLETFRSGWEGTARQDGGTTRFRHGVGEREVYGRARVHTVTFLDGSPIVEGVAADDWQQSQSLLSLLKQGARHTLIRSTVDVPSAYDGFALVDHRSEIDAPYSRNAVALKIPVDDLDHWVMHAILRRRAKGREP